MEDRQNEIQRLAESVAERYIAEGFVDPILIAKDNDIDVVYNRYGKEFKGVISCSKSKKFNICLNTDVIKSPHHPDGRLTCSHELGHFFIDHHRQELMKGYTFSFGGEFCNPYNDPIEQEADHFGINLLLPKQKVLKAYSELPPGWEGILSVKNDFETPITCTAKQYVLLGLTASMLISSTSRPAVRKMAISPDFENFSGKNPYVSINPKRVIREKTERIYRSTGMKIISGYSSLGNWVRYAEPEQNRSLMVFEETIYPQKKDWSLSLITVP